MLVKTKLSHHIPFIQRTNFKKKPTSSTRIQIQSNKSHSLFPTLVEHIFLSLRHIPKTIEFSRMMRTGYGGLKGLQRIGLVTSTATSTSRRCVHFPIRCMSSFNDYAILGLSPFASKSDVKFAYKRLALKYHPDVIKGDQVAEKHKIFLEIKSAYETIMLKFEEKEQWETMQDHVEYDEWDEEYWMGYEGGMPGPSHSY